mmetsp:Transcript_28787/g.71759  ORF Transcript_28787/g.71759 Transcript_28787/m.71759 type:complete len:340 (-) Transcript_28787:229-1248(-)
MLSATDCAPESHAGRGFMLAPEKRRPRGYGRRSLRVVSRWMVATPPLGSYARVKLALALPTRLAGISPSISLRSTSESPSSARSLSSLIELIDMHHLLSMSERKLPTGALRSERRPPSSSSVPCFDIDAPSNSRTLRSATSAGDGSKQETAPRARSSPQSGRRRSRRMAMLATVALRASSLSSSFCSPITCSRPKRCVPEFFSLPLRSTRPRSESSVATPFVLSAASSSYGSSFVPSRRIRSHASLYCCGMEQCISSDRMTGRSLVTKAHSAIASATWTNFSMVHSVCPCVTTGRKFPSQQSISRWRQPWRSWRRYASAEERPVSWSPTMYELCEHAHQ